MKNYLLTIMILGALGLSAQSDMLLYNFNAIPQSLHTNPSYPQQTKFWIGLPAVSGVSVHYHNSGFALIDLLETGTDINTNFDALLLELDDESQLAINESLELLGLGWKAGRNFWSFGINQNMDYRMDYPVDLLKLVKYGNAGQDFRNSSLENFDYEVLNRINFYVGFQREINDRLDLGFRFKYIKGQQHGFAEKTNASITTTDSSSLVLESDIRFKTAGVSTFMDEKNPFGEFGINSVLPQNNGFGLDLGFNYDLTEKLNISASVLDLGYINWTANTRDFVSEGRYVFDGFEADLSNDNPVQSFDQIVDSLGAAFKFEEVDGETYTRWLAPRAFAAVNLNLSERHAFGLLYHARMWQGQAFHDYGINYQGRVSRFFQFTVNYSVINGTMNNVGGGFSLKLGPLQIYALSDNILHALMYENLQTTNVRAGVNLTFYGKKGPRLPDVPPVVPVEEPETEEPANSEGDGNQN